jgi:hypothetical protein
MENEIDNLIDDIYNQIDVSGDFFYKGYFYNTRGEISKRFALQSNPVDCVINIKDLLQLILPYWGA